MKLALGTVQFGMPYGVANQRGQVSPAEVGAILAAASNAGIDTIDTAIAYCDSEACLGQAGVAGLKVVTKLPPVPPQCADVAAWVRAQVLTSLQRLRLERLHGLLLHQAGQLGGVHGATLVTSLQALKAEKLVDKIGVSIYAPGDLEMASSVGLIDLVQAPFNLFDRRLLHSGWLHRLAEEGAEVHVRSAFLQGLLLMPSTAVPAKFAPWAEQLVKWHGWLEAHPHITAWHACLAFVASHPQVDRIVIGVDDLAQLQLLLAAAVLPLMEAMPDLSCTDEMLINPSNWNSL
jgi:aryl-alcohol dehydrogenase-like predicted oxidoreductase